MNFSVDQICNIGGCVLIFLLLFVLIFKPKSLTGLIEGQSSPTNSNALLEADEFSKESVEPAKVANTVLKPPMPQQNQVMASLPLGDNEQFVLG